MDLFELIKKNRSYRRFDESQRLTKEQLATWVDLARLSPSGMNLQPLKYKLIVDQETCDAVFPNLGWAGAIKDWDGPVPGERPAAYIIVLGDKNIRPSFGVDPGIVMQSILLGAVADGYGGCMLGSIKREALAKFFNLPVHLQIVNIIALGKPVEKVVLEEIEKDGDIKYYRDADAVHHVPKRKLVDILVD